jgi:hypothetical protein
MVLSGCRRLPAAYINNMKPGVDLTNIYDRVCRFGGIVHESIYESEAQGVPKLCPKYPNYCFVFTICHARHFTRFPIITTGLPVPDHRAKKLPKFVQVLYVTLLQFYKYAMPMR